MKVGGGIPFALHLKVVFLFSATSFKGCSTETLGGTERAGSEDISTLILPTSYEENKIALRELVVKQTLAQARDRLPISQYCVPYFIVPY